MLINMHKQEYNEIRVSETIHGLENSNYLTIEPQKFYLKINYVIMEDNKQMFPRKEKKNL